MKTGSILNRHLLFSAVLFLLIAGALLTTPQDALAQAPTVSSITIKTSAGDDNTYAKDDKISFEVTFSESVNVNVTTGTPYLSIDIGTEDENASYISGTGTTKLMFSYTVAAGDKDTDGISIGQNKIVLNGGSIKKADNTADANLNHSAVAASTSHKVDGVAPTIDRKSITSSAGSDNTYKTGDKISVTMNFSKSVKVTGTPQLTLKIGTADRTASYKTGNNSKDIVFEYTVAAGDADTDGISIEADKLTLNGGTIKDAVGNAASLTHTALAAESSHKVDAVAPTVSSIAITSNLGSSENNIYVKDDTIQVTATFSESVNVTGTPQLTLKIGSADKIAAYTSGSGSTKLVFEYTVISGDADTDGIEIAANKLANNGGSTIEDAAGNAATLTHTALDTQTSHKVDTTKPTVSSVAITSTATNNYYKKDDKIQATVTFSEKVTVTDTPQLTLTIGSTDREANYKRPEQLVLETKALIFEYTIVDGDNDTDGISIAADQLANNGGSTIEDAAGNAATLTHTALDTQTSHKVDTTKPTVSSVAITSTAKTYMTGEKVQATVTFDENVNVTGTPQLTLKIGDSEKTASYTSGTSTTKLVFEYTVASGDTDTDGVSIAANKLALNSGTIKDTAGNAATLTHTALAAQASHKVDTTAPTVSSIAITSTANSSNIYAAGEKVQATVTFDENVNVTGTPQLTLKIGDSEKTASYTSGTSTTKLVFEYTVASGDTDTDGVSIAANKLALNSGTIKDTAGNAATLTHTALAAQASHKVDTTAPTVSSIAITSTANSSNIYAAGEKVQATVTFDENVNVTDTPQLTLKIGASDKTADYESGSGTTALVFEYTVATNDADTDGISITANSLALNNGTIKDSVGNAATLTHTAVGTQASHKVDGVAPTIVASGISITSTPSIGDSYKADEKVQATVTFSETMKVAGTPQLTLKIGNENKTADYKSGTGSTKLVFEYTVVSGDADTDGIGIEADKLTLPDGTISITDAVGNDATLTHTALLAQTAHKVDAIVPTVRSLSFTSSAGADEVYTAGDKVEVTLTFSENVNVAGTPQLTLKIGNENKTADYMKGTGSTKLVFEYKIVAGDEDTDGVSIAADQLDLNSGTIKDRVSNDATLTHTAITAQTAHKVDAVKPAVTTNGLAITSTSGNNYYKQGATLQVTMTFNETVTVTGTPTLALTIGDSSENASYTSGTGSKTLIFAYTIAAGDTDTDGVSIAANQLTVPSNATIRDSVGNNATLTHTALTMQSSHKVDGVVPTVATNGLAITSTGAPYGVGEKVQATVTFTEKVTVTGTPQLTLKIGSTDKKADWTSGTGTTKLVFEYTVATDDADTDGIEIEANKLALNSGTIKDIAGNDATPTHTALAAQTAHKVDGVAPTIVTDGVSISSGAGDDKTYKTGDKIEATVRFSENISVTGTPQLTLTIGSKSKKALYTGGVNGGGYNRPRF